MIKKKKKKKQQNLEWVDYLFIFTVTMTPSCIPTTVSSHHIFSGDVCRSENVPTQFSQRFSSFSSFAKCFDIINKSKFCLMALYHCPCMSHVGWTYYTQNIISPNWPCRCITAVVTHTFAIELNDFTIHIISLTNLSHHADRCWASNKGWCTHSI